MVAAGMGLDVAEPLDLLQGGVCVWGGNDSHNLGFLLPFQ